MKRIIVLGLVILLAACTPKTETGYEIIGDLASLSGTVYLTIYEGKQPTRIDSTEVQNGAFVFTGSVDLPIYAAVENANGLIVRFFLENSPISLKGDMSTPNAIAVTGSKVNDQYRAYKHDMDSVTAIYYIDSLGAVDNRASDSMMMLVNNEKMNYIKANPASIVSAYALYREVSYYLPYQDLYAAVDALDLSIQNSVYVKMVRTMADALKKTAVGQPYVDISAPDREGNEVKLSSVIGPGKYVLLDFWASWCPPCRAEMPVMIAAYKEYKPKGFEIYAVSLDRTRDAWVSYIDRMKLEWVQVSRLEFWTSDAAEAYGVRSIPSNVLIGPDGTIIARNLMGHDLGAKLAELMP